MIVNINMPVWDRQGTKGMLKVLAALWVQKFFCIPLETGSTGVELLPALACQDHRQMVGVCKGVVMMNVHPAVHGQWHHLGFDGTIILTTSLSSGMRPCGGLPFMDVREGAGDGKIVAG